MDTPQDPGAHTAPPRTDREPPSLGGAPLLGSLPRLLLDPLGFTHRALRERGDLVHVRLGLGDVYLVGHPQLAQHVLRDRSDNYDRGGMLRPLRQLLGDGLLATEGDYWRAQRRLLQPLFSRQRLAELVPLMGDAVAGSLTEWPQRAEGAPADLFAAMTAVAMRVILRTMFAASLDEAHIARVRDALRGALSHLTLLVFTQGLPGWLPRPGARRFRSQVALIDAEVYRTIEAQRRGGGTRAALLGALLDAQDSETGRKMTDRQVRDEAMAFFIAGFETAATMLTWALHLLIQHPEVEARVRAEIEAELGARAPTYDDLQRLRYTRQVLQESLRLCSPSWMIPRRAVAADEVGGYRVRAGASMLVLIHALHRHRDFWPDPEAFRPERFAEELPHRCAYLPFGFGPHQCIGAQFALLEGQLVLAMVLQRFRIRPAPGQRVRPAAGVTYYPRGGIPVLLFPR